MSTTQVNEIVARPTRTFTQAGTAIILVEFWDSFIRDLSEKQYGAAVGLVTVLLAILLIAGERLFGKTFLRAEPPATVPVVDDPDVPFGNREDGV